MTVYSHFKKNDPRFSEHSAHEPYKYGFDSLCGTCERPIPYASDRELERLGWEIRTSVTGDFWMCPVCLEDEIMGGEKGV